MIHAKIIYSNREIRKILVNKAKEGMFYLMLDDIFFEEIKKNENISREFYTNSRRITSSINVIKHISFKLKNNVTTKDIYDLIKKLREKNCILLTLFNTKENECDLLFISNGNDLELEKYINDFIEIEEI